MPRCFVLMPFAARFKEVYDYGIEPAATAAGFTCDRVDKAFAPRAIIADIITGIFSADVIVADISGSNPNVFYELGVANTIDNKTVVICGGDDHKLPFNLRAYRVIFYSRTVEGIQKDLRDQLEQALRGAATWRSHASNPVQDFRPVHYTVPLQKQAETEGQIARLKEELRALRGEKERREVMAVILLLPEVEFQHLRNLASEGPFNYLRRDPFLAELRKLRSLGLIRMKGGATIGGLPKEGDLKDYLELSDPAREVLEELFRRFAQ